MPVAYFWVDEADEQVAAVAAGAVGAMRNSSGEAQIEIVRAGVIPEGDRVVVVAAERLAAALAAGLPAARIVLLNADRGEVLDLLERHRLAGAIECDDPSVWREPGARLFARRALIGEHGETIGGEGRESDHYVLWRDERYPTLAALLKDYAYGHIADANANRPTIVTAADCARAGLPPVRIEVVTGDALSGEPLPRPGVYLGTGSMPGTTSSFSITASTERAGTAGALERAARALFTRGPAPLVGALQPVDLVGERLEGLCAIGGEGNARRAACVVLLDRAPGTLLLAFLCPSQYSDELSCARVLRYPHFERIVASLKISDG